MSTPGASLPRLSRHLAIVAVGLLFAAACSGAADPAAPTVARPTPTPTGAVDAEETEVVVPSPTPTAAPERERVTPSPAPAPTPRPNAPGGYLDDLDFDGAATASVEERIWHADVIVHATLERAAAGNLTFRVVEYLHGSGPKSITVSADTAGRLTTWDSQAAVLFLKRAAAGSARSDSSAFEFADTTTWRFGTESWVPEMRYTGDLPEGYTVDSRNPVWVPVSSGAAGTTVQAGGESLSLADLRTKVAWVKGGAGVPGYADCVLKGLSSIRYYRAHETITGSPYTRPQLERSIGSGAPDAIVFESTSTDFGPALTQYMRWFVEGTDAEIFSPRVVDPDGDPFTGFTQKVTSARPLPAGTYRFTSRTQWPREMPCNFRSEHSGGDWVVTVTAPAGTTHEAFFDPVAIGTAVGADAANGALKPKAFTVGGSSTSLSSLTWQGGSVVLTLSPYAALTGQTLDVLAVDGALTLSLAASAATVDAAAGTLTWSVASQPWQAGDLLMLRLRSGAASPTATPTATPSVTATPTFGPTPTPS